MPKETSERPIGARAQAGTRPVGGGLSQGSIFFGSGIYGAIHENVLSLEIVLGDGTVVRTGSAANKAGIPFQRYFGPDLTGLFLGDAGSLGVKTKVTFRLIYRPKMWSAISYGYDSFEDMIEAQTEIGRGGYTSECVGLDQVAGGNSTSLKMFSEGVKKLGSVAKSAGVKKAVDVAMAGTTVLQGHACTLHITADANSEEECNALLARASAVCERTGTPIESSVPTVLRSDPFPDVGGYLVSGDGRRWISHSRRVFRHRKIMDVS